MRYHPSEFESAFTYHTERRRPAPADRFEIWNGEEIVDRLSMEALAVKRKAELEQERPDFRGRLTVVDTWKAKK